MKRVVWLVLLGVTGLAVGGEPRVPLEKWTTTDGKTAEAAFQSVDEASGTVTILVPKTIELSRLDADSRRLALAFDESGKRRSPWGGLDPLAIGLGRPGYAEWLQASESQRAATMGNFVFEMLFSGAFVNEIRLKMSTPKAFNEFSSKLALAVTEVVKGSSDEEKATGNVVDLAYMLLVASNNIRKAGER